MSEDPENFSLGQAPEYFINLLGDLKNIIRFFDWEQEGAQSLLATIFGRMEEIRKFKISENRMREEQEDDVLGFGGEVRPERSRHRASPLGRWPRTRRRAIRQRCGG